MQGRQTIPEQMLLKIPDAVFNNLLICGEPGSAECQILFTGPHLNLRIGGANREGVAFGGPQVYGDQRGNETAGDLPGNVYHPQFAAGMALFEAAEPQASRKLRYCPTSPDPDPHRGAGCGRQLRRRSGGGDDD